MSREQTSSEAAAEHTTVPFFGRVTASSEEELAHARIRDTHDLEIDEMGLGYIPYGEDRAPCPGDYLCTAVAGCQLEILRQCLEKARVDDYEITIEYERTTVDSGTETGPMPDHASTRVGEIALDLEVETTEEYESRVRRCLEVCHDGCIIGRSVEAGIDLPITKSLVVDGKRV